MYNFDLITVRAPFYRFTSLAQTSIKKKTIMLRPYDGCAVPFQFLQKFQVSAFHGRAVHSSFCFFNVIALADSWIKPPRDCEHTRQILSESYCSFAWVFLCPLSWSRSWLRSDSRVHPSGITTTPFFNWFSIRRRQHWSLAVSRKCTGSTIWALFFSASQCSPAWILQRVSL